MHKHIAETIASYFRVNSTEDLAPLTICETHKSAMRGKSGAESASEIRKVTFLIYLIK